MTDEDRGAALEAAIDEHPDQATNYLVLADWLQERQDPRGELIILSKHKDVGRCAALQKALGPTPLRNGGQTWFYGFVRTFNAIVNDADVSTLRAFFDHPSVRHATMIKLLLAGGEDDDRQWLVDLIAERARPCWRDLTINSYWRGGNDPPAGDLDLDPLWRKLPRLSSLTVSARFLGLGSLTSETLTSLVLDGGVSIADLQPLLASSIPKLRRLELTDVDPQFAMTLGRAPLASQLESVKLPYVPPDVQERVKHQLPTVTFFPQDDGDRYEQLGE